MSSRRVQRLIAAQRTSEGAGVTLYRSLGQSQFARLDPFLMLDEFGSDRPDEYIAGFPAHPHRGFETVTYMLEGRMRHEDHLGNVGLLGAGDVQWMTAGRGIIRSEMPQQQSGRMRGFQLWINLPAREKMGPAGYRDIAAAQIPEFRDATGLRVKVVAGRWQHDDRVFEGPVSGVSTAPVYIDVELPAGGRFVESLPATHSALVYVFEGELQAESEQGARLAIVRRHAAIFGAGERLEVSAGEQGARFLMLAAAPIGEPVVQYGPFVMTTRAEIEQAIADYQAGRLTG